jgi:hypothetical protein
MMKNTLMGLLLATGLMMASAAGAQADPVWGVGFHTGGWGSGVSVSVGNAAPVYPAPVYPAPVYPAPYAAPVYPAYGASYVAPPVYPAAVVVGPGWWDRWHHWHRYYYGPRYRY